MSDSALTPLLIGLVMASIVAGSIFVLWLSRLPRHPRHRLGVALRPLSICTLILSACIVGGFGYQLFSGNIHTVIAGELYRSGQLTPSKLAGLSKVFGIRSMINLRGENTTEPWYQSELHSAEGLGIQHIDFQMSAKRELTNDAVAKLVAIMKNAPKPLLLHCQGGADRTGLAAAIYLSAIAGQNEEVAEQQLSASFGHFGIPYLTPSYALDETWETYERNFNTGK